MRNLWRATAQLFWQHPILWVPVALADAIALSLSHLQRLLQHAADGLMQTHSVLGGRPDLSSSPDSVVATYLISISLAAIAALTTAFLYTIALLTVASMLRGLAAQGRASLDTAAASVKLDLRRGLFFSLRLFIISVIAGMVASSLVLFAEWLLKANYFSLDPRFTLAESILSAIATAYLITPHAVNLLRPAGSVPPARQPTLLARLAAIGTVTLSIALNFLLAKAVFPASPHAVQVAARAIASEIATLPYAALFIALALIAAPETPAVIAPRAPSEARPPHTPNGLKDR
jgi:hypothetical protein